MAQVHAVMLWYYSRPIFSDAVRLHHLQPLYSNTAATSLPSGQSLFLDTGFGNWTLSMFMVVQTGIE